MLDITVDQPTLGVSSFQAQDSGDVEIKATDKFLEILHADRWGDRFPTCSMFEPGSDVTIKHSDAKHKIFGENV